MSETKGMLLCLLKFKGGFDERYGICCYGCLVYKVKIERGERVKGKEWSHDSWIKI